MEANLLTKIPSRIHPLINSVDNAMDELWLAEARGDLDAIAEIALRMEGAANRLQGAALTSIWDRRTEEKSRDQFLAKLVD